MMIPITLDMPGGMKRTPFNDERSISNFPSGTELAHRGNRSDQEEEHVVVHCDVLGHSLREERLEFLTML